MKAPYLFTSLQLIQLCETITSLKTKIEFIRLLGPRLIDPSSKVSTFLSMFRYNDDKQNVENILRTRQTSLIQSQFIMVDNNDNNGNSNINNNNNNNSNSSSNTNNDSGKDGFNMNNNNSPVKSTVNNSRKSSSILSRRIVGGRGGGGSSNRNSFGGNSSTITSTDADAASATDADATTTDATDNDYIKDESCNSITSSPLSQPHVSSPHVSPSIVVTATESEEGSRIYDKSINNNNNNNTSTSISSLDVVDVTLNLNDTSSLLDVHNKDNHHLSLIKEDADQNHNDDIHNDVFLNGDNKHCFHDDDDGDLVGDDNDVLFDSRPLASHCSNRQSLIWANRLSSFMDNHY